MLISLTPSAVRRHADLVHEEVLLARELCARLDALLQAVLEAGGSTAEVEDALRRAKKVLEGSRRREQWLQDLADSFDEVSHQILVSNEEWEARMLAHYE